MAARRQPVAVLFADIRGFTRLSESLGTEATIELLTEFHERFTRIVFEHGGTLEKYIGDAVMATFGTPSRGVDDAGRALQCAWHLADETHHWSREREIRGRAPVSLGIGVHYGEAGLGSIGDVHLSRSPLGPRRSRRLRQSCLVTRAPNRPSQHQRRGTPRPINT